MRVRDRSQPYWKARQRGEEKAREESINSDEISIRKMEGRVSG